MNAEPIDPVKRELVKNALISICDSMLVTIVRTARSTNIKNTMDFSGALCDAGGRLVAQGLAVPAHLGAIMPALKGCMDYFGDDIGEGDILASNDPYSGCSHLNDIFMFKPVFALGRRDRLPLPDPAPHRSGRARARRQCCRQRGDLPGRADRAAEQDLRSAAGRTPPCCGYSSTTRASASA